jgi:hypothetical protein
VQPLGRSKECSANFERRKSNQLREFQTYFHYIWNAAVSSENERVELAMSIMRYRALASSTTDEALLAAIRAKIAQLEQKLREIGE